MLKLDVVELFRILRANKRGTLSLDVGKKYIGVALTTQDNSQAEPLCQINRPKKGEKDGVVKLACILKKMITDNHLAGVVIGHPYLYGKPSENVTEIHRFVAELSLTKVLDGMPFAYYDESYSSARVRHMMYPIELDTIDTKRIGDEFAAQGIGQAFLDAMAWHEKMQEDKEEAKSGQGKNLFMISQGG